MIPSFIPVNNSLLLPLGVKSRYSLRLWTPTYNLSSVESIFFPFLIDSRIYDGPIDRVRRVVAGDEVLVMSYTKGSNYYHPYSVAHLDAMTDYSAPSPLTASASSETTTNYAWKAFDKNGSTYWTSQSPMGAYETIELDLGADYNLSAIHIRAMAGFPAYMIKDFLIQVKPDGGSYSTVKTVTNSINWAANEWREYYFTPVTGRYIRLYITDTNIADQLTGVGEIIVYKDLGTIDSSGDTYFRTLRYDQSVNGYHCFHTTEARQPEVLFNQYYGWPVSKHVYGNYYHLNQVVANGYGQPDLFGKSAVSLFLGAKRTADHATSNWASGFGASNNFMGLRLENSGDLEAWMSDGAGQVYGSITAGSVQDQWQHLLMIFNGDLTGDTNRLKLYKNNSQQTFDSFNGTIPSISPTGTICTPEGGMSNYGYFTGHIWGSAQFSDSIESDRDNFNTWLSEYLS